MTRMARRPGTLTNRSGRPYGVAPFVDLAAGATLDVEDLDAYPIAAANVDAGRLTFTPPPPPARRRPPRSAPDPTPEADPADLEQPTGDADPGDDQPTTPTPED